MRKLTKAEILQLPEGRSVQHVRLARIMSPVIDGKEQHEVFVGAREVSVHRREKTIKRGRNTYPAGEITTITTADGKWAEAREQDVEANGSIVIEDYVMEIFG